MPFASEEAVVMLFFVAKETEPWTLQAGGKERTLFHSWARLVISTCDQRLWMSWDWGSFSEVHFQNCVPYLLMFVFVLVEIDVKAGGQWHSSTLVRLMWGRWQWKAALSTVVVEGMVLHCPCQYHPEKSQGLCMSAWSWRTSAEM